MKGPDDDHVVPEPEAAASRLEPTRPLAGGREGERIGLAHGAGGRAMRNLIEELFVVGADTGRATVVGLHAMDDGAVFPLGDRFLVFATDSHVIQPIFFPGGDIGRLAVAGTANDLAMMGGTEVLGISSALVIEEGFPLADLVRIQRSMTTAAKEAGTTIVTGDTKVMGRGEVDGIVITTSGVALADRVVRKAGLRVGDDIVVTGTVGDHGFAVMAARNDLSFESVGEEGTAGLRSDVAPLVGLVERLLVLAGDDLHAMTDPTRGGLGGALYEMAKGAEVGVRLLGDEIPIRPAVRALAELLGIDPLQVANEGKIVLGVAPEATGRVVAGLREHPLAADCRHIGTVVAAHPGRVMVDTGFGTRFVPEPDGELLPRIC